jgi:prolyl oligopeptidase
MSRSQAWWAAVASLLLACTGTQAPVPEGAAVEVGSPGVGEQEGERPLVYPATRQDEVEEDHHGTLVKDPYRWLEDTDSEETRRWIAAQSAVTASFLAAIPGRAALERRLTARWNFEKFGIPLREGGRYFWTKNDGLQNQSVVYWAESLDASPKVLIDPNRMSEDGTVALAGPVISPDGNLAAYGLQSAGSDWVEWRVRRVESGEDLSDRVQWAKFSRAAWDRDSSGFYYSRYPEPEPGAALTGANFHHAIYYHRAGTSQSEDRLVYRRPDRPRWLFGPSVTEDGRYLVVSVHEGTSPKNQVLFQDRKARGKPAMKTLVGAFEAKFDFIGSEGPVLWFVTDLDAPHGRVIAIDTRRPARARWRELVPQGDHTIQGASTAGGRIFVEYLQDASSRIAVHDPTGKHLADVELPGLGSARGFAGRREHTETFYSFASFTTPPSIYRLELASGTSEVVRQPKVDFDSARYQSKQVFFTSKDGTRVPMFITHKKGLALDGSNPTIMYGYGGFSVSLTPWFSAAYSVWMDLGGVLAIPNLRGGGEYGREWHLAGTRDRKQNVFDDFIAGAEWLIANRYTAPSRLAIQGSSNGGLLVAACMLQRPDLFGAALPGVGVMDMLRFHKFTIGWAWIDDYGSADDPEEFKTLLAYSPLHNIKSGTSYPATLVTTADHDDRVVPGHSFKFIAALQAAQTGAAPTLIRIQTRAGHGAGKPTSMRIAEAADQLAFLIRVFGM